MLHHKTIFSPQNRTPPPPTPPPTAVKKLRLGTRTLSVSLPLPHPSSILRRSIFLSRDICLGFLPQKAVQECKINSPPRRRVSRHTRIGALGNAHTHTHTRARAAYTPIHTLLRRSCVRARRARRRRRVGSFARFIPESESKFVRPCCWRSRSGEKTS